MNKKVQVGDITTMVIATLIVITLLILFAIVSAVIKKAGSNYNGERIPKPFETEKEKKVSIDEYSNYYFPAVFYLREYINANPDKKEQTLKDFGTKWKSAELWR